jgi:hypothetical protein
LNTLLIEKKDELTSFLLLSHQDGESLFFSRHLGAGLGVL